MSGVSSENKLINHFCVSQIPIKIPDPEIIMGPEGYGTLTVSIIGYCRQCGNTLVSRRSMPWVDKKADYYVYREYWMTLYMTLREFVGNFVSIPDKVMEVPKNAGG